MEYAKPLVSFGGDKPGHDDTLYIGLLALVDDRYQEMLKSCIGADGRLYRNPILAKKLEAGDNGTSRDMLAGLMFLKDKEALRSFAVRLKKNHGNLSTKGDGRRKMRLSGWGQLYKMGVCRDLKSWFGSLFVRPVTVFEAFSRKGYQLNLVLVKLLWLKYVVKEWGFWEKLACRVLEQYCSKDAVLAHLQGKRQRSKNELEYMRHAPDFESDHHKDHWVFGREERHIHYLVRADVCCEFLEKLQKFR